MKKSTDENFTLIELMITICIIGILAAVAIPISATMMQAAKENEAELNNQRGSSYIEDAPSEELEDLAPWESHYEEESNR